MRNTVVWLKSAEHELAELWLNAAEEQQKLADAADQIEQLLRTETLDRANTVSAGRFELTVPPLRVHFAFSPDDCKVSIVEVWRIKSPLS